MKPNLNRRDFITKSAIAGISCCFLKAGTQSGELFSMPVFQTEKPDPKKLNYCGYQCPPDCPFLKASLENDPDQKKNAYDLWEIRERYGVEFSPDEIFCYGCKTKDKPEGVVLVNCTVRSCVISKGLECCIECGELTECKKDLWDRFPDFKQMVIEMQKQYS